MHNVNTIFKSAINFENRCYKDLIKESFIKHLPNGKWRVVSRKGKNLGTYDSKEKAVERLQAVEYFKHKGASRKFIDLTDIDEFAYSAIIRKLKEKGTAKDVYQFMNIFKKEFDRAYKNGDENPEEEAITKALSKFNNLVPIKLPEDMTKVAAASQLGNSELVGKYLSDIIRFTMNRISPERRSKSLQNLKNKIHALDEKDIAGKNMPASSSIGSAITFVKHILFNQDARYVREVLNSISRHL